MTETTFVQRLLLSTSKIGMRIFRNQVGRYRLARPECRECQAHGRVIASGLCVGSSDLVGWTPVIVTPEMVGRTLAVFTAVEAKVGRRQTTPEQARFLDVVQAAGGIATLARETSDVELAAQRFATSCGCTQTVRGSSVEHDFSK